jgi:sigma-B regulation protein RsbU (phosphoserine phosphatase)
MQNHDEKIKYLRNSTFLHSAPAAMLNRLALYADKVRLQAGEMVFTKGEEGKCMYIVVDGCVKVHDNDVVLKHLYKGDVFGEIGAFAPELRTASITAEVDSVLFKLEQDSLYETLAQQPEAARSIIQALCEKERDIVRDGTESAIKVRVLERDMEIARRIQQNFLPDTLPEVDGWEMTGHLRPAREVAGDFYDFFPLPAQQRIGIVIGDVCDKGIGAALFMTLFRSLIRATSLTGEFQDWQDQINDSSTMLASTTIRTEPATILQHSLTLTNRYIATTHARSNMFASVFFGLLDTANGELLYINAGHEPPVILNLKGIRQQLEPTGPVIGLFNEAKHTVQSVQLGPGDMLLAYTDGVTEAKNMSNEMFSEERLYSLLKNNLRSTKALVDRILGEVSNFTDKANQFDDITIIAIQRHVD